MVNEVVGAVVCNVAQSVTFYSLHHNDARLMPSAVHIQYIVHAKKCYAVSECSNSLFVVVMIFSEQMCKSFNKTEKLS